MREGWVDPDALWQRFDEIEPLLLRYPGIDAREFRESVRRFIVEQRADGGER